MTPEFPSKVRRRPTRAKQGGAPRDSSLIRASVLETALELGFGQNSTVADWIFNNPLSEEAEEALPGQDDSDKLDSRANPVLETPEATTPTSGSNSISDESSSLNSPANVAPSTAVAVIQVHTHKPSITESPQVHFGDFSADQLQLFSPFALSPRDVLRNGSLTKLPEENERPRSQDDGLPRNHTCEVPSPGSADFGYTSEGQYLSKGKAGKGKDKPGKSRRNKGSKSKVLDDGKTSEKDGDYTSDGGYLSASSNKSQSKSPGRVKSRAMAFFRRRPKKSASDDEDEASIPPVPALPTIPRPSSPKILERRPTPSSPTRSGFSPLTLNLTSPPTPPPRRVSKSPPPLQARTASPKRLDHVSAPQRPISPLVPSTSSPTPPPPAPTVASPLLSSIPDTPHSTTSPSIPSTSLGGGAGTTHKSLSTSPSRQHLTIPPPAPPPTLPLPQPPPPPSDGLNGGPPLPAAPTIPSRRRVSTRPVPVAPTSAGSMQPLSPHRVASPLRPLLSPRTSSAASHDQLVGKGFNGRQRSATAFTAGFGSTPAFLQRKIQYGPPPSPRRPPPDAPLPPSPSSAPGTRPRTPVAPSKFHEHFSSVSSVPLSQDFSTPTSVNSSLSIATPSESSSGPSMRSSYISSVSGGSEEPVRELNVPERSRPTTSVSIKSEGSQPIVSVFNRPAINPHSHFSGWSDVSSSIYSSTMHRESSSVTTYDAEDADIEDAAPKSGVDQEDDDASVYPSEDKTAGRRTMYLLENGGLDENGDEIVIAGSRYWDGHAVPPPLPPLPPLPKRPGPGYF